MFIYCLLLGFEAFFVSSVKHSSICHDEFALGGSLVEDC